MRSVQPDLLDALVTVHRLFQAHGIWHCLAYGTLLGAVRDGDLIAWDYDFDLFVRPADVPRILALNEVALDEGYGFTWRTTPGSHLAIDTERVAEFDCWGIWIHRHGRKVGDLFVHTLFDDGVLRRYDPRREIYWAPHNSFPHYFVERLDSVELGGVRFPAPRDAEKWLEGVYGADWRTPYRAVLQGGAARSGRTIYSHRYAPKLGAEIAWCVARGWDRSQYAGQRRWPRRIAGAGPRGPTPRTVTSSGALWWRDLEELAAYY